MLGKIYKKNELQMLEKVIDNINISINIFDSQGKRIFVNPYYYHLAGKKKGLRFGQKFNSGKKLRRSDSVLDDKIKESVRTGKVFEIRNYFYRSHFKKTPRYFDILIGPIRNNKEQIIGAYSVAKDETSRYLAKHKIINLNKNLERRIVERTNKLEKANRKLNRASDDKNLLLSHVAHEIKTTLTVIKGNAEIIEETIKNSGNILAIECYGEINKETVRLNKIVSDLVFITKTEAYANLFKFENLNITKIIREAIKKYKALYDKTDFKIYFPAGKNGNIFIMADKLKIQTLISNLIENAAKYSKEQGRLDITLRSKNHSVIMEFKDNGQGIAEENMDYIFDPFYQVKKTNHSKINRGFGLGLAICKKIVSAHKGSIAAESKLGAGTTFTVVLPKEKNS